MATGPTDWEKQNKDKAKTSFERAHSNQQVQQPERVDSEQVKNTKLGLQNGPKPPQPGRNTMAAQTHNKQTSNDQARVDAAAQRNAKLTAERQASGLEQQSKQKQAGKEAEQKRAIGTPQNSQVDKNVKALDQNAKNDKAAGQQKSNDAKALERNEGARVAREGVDRVKSKDEKQR